MKKNLNLQITDEAIEYLVKNSFDNTVKYDSEQKEFIKKHIFDIAQ